MRHLFPILRADLAHVRAVGYSCRTNKQSNTAFRGFGGPQGVLVMEDALDRIARHLGRDANDVREQAEAAKTVVDTAGSA